MANTISIFNKIMPILMVIIAILPCTRHHLSATTASCCSLVVPVTGRRALLASNDVKVIQHNLKKAAVKIETVRQQIHVSPDHVQWKIPNALLRSCNISLPGYCCDCNDKAISVVDRVASIVLDDVGVVSDESSHEVVKFLKKINKHKQMFDQQNASAICWINGLVVIHEKKDVSSSSDRLIIGLKVNSREDKLAKIIEQLDKRMANELGIPADLKAATVPLALFTNLERSQAVELVGKFEELKNSLIFDKRPFRLRQFYIQKLCQDSGPKLIGPWDIQNFSYISKH